MKKEFSKSDKILIAGANGMVGSAICRKLFSKGYKNIFKPSRKQLDYLNSIEVRNWFNRKKPNIVVIAAAKVGGILANSSQPTEFLLENTKIQSNIIEASWQLGVKKLIFLGSSCIYPKEADQPIKEEYLLSGPLENTNISYAIAKISGIQLCNSLRKQYGFNAMSLMPTNLYGPGDNFDDKNSHVIAGLIQRFYRAKTLSKDSVICWGSGLPMREFLFVDDFGEAVVFALERWDPNSKDAPKDKHGNPLLHLNVGTGKDISIRDLAEKISNIIGFKGNIIWDKDKPDGTAKKLLDVSKINKLGWHSKTSLEDGIKKTIKETDLAKIMNIQNF